MNTLSKTYTFALVAFLAVGLWSCSRPQLPPIHTPPVAMWPTNVLSAIQILRTSQENDAREDAATVIDEFLSKCRSAYVATNAWQPLSVQTITSLLGPPSTTITTDDGSPIYRVAHYSGVETLLQFRQRDGLVILVSIGHGDGPVCTLHDHSNEFNTESEDTEPSARGDGIPPPQP